VIVTRRRRKPFPWRRLLLPVIAIALVIFAFVWGPSRNVIAAGPLAPLWQNVGSHFDTIAAPFHFAAQNQVINDRNKQIVQLQAQVTQLQAQSSDKDKKISALNSTIGQMQQQAANANAAPAAAPTGVAQANPGAANPGEPPAAGDTTQLRRTAELWANMQPENAAKVIQKLPVPYVAQVLALMSADDAGAILDAVPAAYAAQLTQENPGLKK
jgi:flagellar motility protein MotE (MotC chaperone)